MSNRMSVFVKKINLYVRKLLSTYLINSLLIHFYLNLLYFLCLSITIKNRFMKPYRSQLIESLSLLKVVREHLLTQVVNISAESELKDILSVFEEGDSYTFEIEQFENSKDVNVQMLLALCKEIENVYTSIHNVNALTSEEMTSVTK